MGLQLRMRGGSDISCSHPDRIVGLSQQIAAGAALLDEQSAAARNAVASVGSIWHGSSETAFEEAGTHLASQLARDASVLSDISSALLEMAATLEGAHELWHQAEAAQQAAASTAAAGMPIDTPEADSLAAQARDQVALAVERSVLAFTSIEPESWLFGEGAIGRIVYEVEHEVASVMLAVGASGDDEVDGQRTVADVLAGKRGSIKNAPLPAGSPSWAEVSKMTMAQVRALARQNTPGYRTIWKLLTDRRFNK